MLQLAGPLFCLYVIWCQTSKILITYYSVFHFFWKKKAYKPQEWLTWKVFKISSCWHKWQWAGENACLSDNYCKVYHYEQKNAASSIRHECYLFADSVVKYNRTGRTCNEAPSKKAHESLVHIQLKVAWKFTNDIMTSGPPAIYCLAGSL